MNLKQVLVGEESRKMNEAIARAVIAPVGNRHNLVIAAVRTVLKSYVLDTDVITWEELDFPNEDPSVLNIMDEVLDNPGIDELTKFAEMGRNPEWWNQISLANNMAYAFLFSDTMLRIKATVYSAYGVLPFYRTIRGYRQLDQLTAEKITNGVFAVVRSFIFRLEEIVSANGLVPRKSVLHDTDLLVVQWMKGESYEIVESIEMMHDESEIISEILDLCGFFRFTDDLLPDTITFGWLKSIDILGRAFSTHGVFHTLYPRIQRVWIDEYHILNWLKKQRSRGREVNEEALKYGISAFLEIMRDFETAASRTQFCDEWVKKIR